MLDSEKRDSRAYLIPLTALLIHGIMGFHILEWKVMGSFRPDLEFSEGSLFNQLFLTVVYIIALAFLLAKRDSFLNLLKANWLLIIFLLYAMISCLWSPVPSISFRRWIQSAGIVLIAMSALRGKEWQQVWTVFLWITGLSLSISLLLIVLNPEIAIVNGSWRGLARSKNGLGGIAALAFAIWLPALLRKNTVSQKMAIFVIPIAMVLLIGSKSASALLTWLIIVVAFLFISVPIPASLKACILPIPFLVAAFFFFNIVSEDPFAFMLNSVGRDSTLTGRTDVWEEMILYIQDHPFFGVGYNGFWKTGRDGLSSEVLQYLNWSPGQAHNGYLDIINELGFFGLAFFLLLLMQTLSRVVRLLHHNKVEGLPYFLIVIALIFINFVETNFCRASFFGWTAFLASLLVSTPILRRNGVQSEITS